MAVHAENKINLTTIPGYTSLLGGHFIYRAHGTLTTPPSVNVVQNISDNPNEWGYNTHIGSNGLQLREGETAHAILDHEGLRLVKGGIRAGYDGNNGFIYLSTIGYPLANPDTHEEGLTINGHTPTIGDGETTGDSPWQEVIGTRFGVDSEGNLYASNATIKGDIVATSLTIGEFDDSYNAAAAINAASYSIEIISDTTDVSDPEAQVYLYPILYHNGILVDDTEIDYSNFVWYQDNNDIGVEGDAEHEGRYLAIYGHRYRVTYDFTDSTASSAAEVQTRVIDPSKYITKISNTGIQVHPEGNSSDYLQINGDIEIYRGGISVAKYGTTTRIGAEGASRFLVNGNSLDAYSGNDIAPYFHVDTNGLSWGNNTAATLAQVNNAEQVATNYITNITGGGVYIHANDTPSDPSVSTAKGVKITDKIDIIKDGDSVISVGEIRDAGTVNERNIVRIGKQFVENTNNESHIELDFHSLQLIDKEGETYFHISDLRNRSGEVYRTMTWIASGNDKYYYLYPKAKDNDYTVTVSDGSGDGFYEKSTIRFVFNSPPNENAIINVEYMSDSIQNKAYTLGVRKQNSYLGAYSYAEGEGIEASGFISHAEGRNSVASGYVCHAEGLSTKATGMYCHAEGSYTEATGICAHAEGSSTIASGGNSHAEGDATEASGMQSHAEGSDTKASGNQSHAEGGYCVASGESAHAEGRSTEATNFYAHSEGRNTHATGYASHAEGERCTASNDNTHAEGQYSEATAWCAHAEGHYSVASEEKSHAEGDHCTASGYASHAQGIYTTAQGYGQTTIGKWNSPIGHASYYDVEQTDPIFIIGSGDSQYNKKNAFTVDWSGNVKVNGTLVHSSDRRLKEHLSYLSTDAIEFIQSLKPAHFKKDNQSHVGFYAQDVEAVDKWNCMTGEMNGFKTLGYSELIAPLVAYCQHLEKRIEELEKEN